MRTSERIGWMGTSMAIVLGVAACQSETPVPPKPTQVTSSSTPSHSADLTPTPTATASPSRRAQSPIIYSRKLDHTNGNVTETGMFHVFDDESGIFNAMITNGTVDIRSNGQDITCQDDGSVAAVVTTLVYDAPNSDNYNVSKSTRNKRIIIPDTVVATNHYCDNARLNVKSNLGNLAVAIMKESVQHNDTPSDPNVI